jgi:spore coat protein U-like protein
LISFICQGELMHRFIKSAVVAGTLVATGAVHAATATSSFQVTATVLARCTVTATALNFGSYNPGAGDIDVSATNNIAVRCTRGTPYTVGLNAGLAPAATVSTRRMRSAATPAEELAYSLFTTAGRTTNWGDTVLTGAPTGTGTGFGTAANFTVHGRIPDSAANQDALVAADFADTITVTVTY